jgi:hypothetical protein
MKAKVYIETTIPSYLTARRSRDPITAAHQQLTRNWWELRRPAFDLYISGAVLDEAAAGDAILAQERVRLLANIPVLAMTSGIIEIAESLVAAGRSRVRPPLTRFTLRLPPRMAASFC